MYFAFKNALYLNDSLKYLYACMNALVLFQLTTRKNAIIYKHVYMYTHINN